MAVTAGLSLLMLMALRVAAEIRTVYFDNHLGTMTMNPNNTEDIYNITWRYNGEIVIEYSLGYSYRDLEYQGHFKYQAYMTWKTGALTINEMRQSDAGKFTVEINGKVLPITFNAVGINNLANYSVEVSVMPKNCSRQTSNNCTLVCGEQFIGAEPVQYFWNAGKTGEWKMGDKSISVSFTEDTKDLSEYSCKVKNPVSEKPIDEEDEEPIDEEDEDYSDWNEEQTLTESRSGPDPMPAVLLVAVLAVGAAVVV